MDLALKYAKISLKKGEVPVGCVIFYGNNLITYGYNLVNKYNDPLAHAEVVAIRMLIKLLYENNDLYENKDLYENNDLYENSFKNYNKESIYKHLENKYKSKEKLIFYISCEPCLMCLGIIQRLDADVVYGCKNPIFGGSLIENYGKYEHSEESIRLLKEFYKKGNPRTQ